ncbi:MAG: hypothetical protein KY428_07510 [Bacteroidetes bacterium]|nr:hypothetical protein [Bacteroidota bacterium]
MEAIVKTDPVIIAFFDGDDTGKILSNFAHTPFELDGVDYGSAEAFWQSLKTEIPLLRKQIYPLWGYEAKKAGRLVQGSSNLFTYGDALYRVGSVAHHTLLERALCAKFTQNEDARNALIATGTRPLRHMLKNRFGQFRPGDSPALSALTFELMLDRIRHALLTDGQLTQLNLPKGLNEF